MRIMIYGRPGSGKSTFALALSEKLELPLHHLDRYFFTAGWMERNRQEFLAIQRALVNQNSWIIDGCSLQSLEMRYARADICIFMLYPRWLCILRLFTRMFTKNPAIQDRAEGCSETISWSLIKYTWTFEYRKNNRLYEQLAMLRAKYPEVKFYTVKNNQDLKTVTAMLTQK
jgi:adenylate kinase family enzyme